MKAKKNYTEKELEFDFRKCKCGHIYLWHKKYGNCSRSTGRLCRCKRFELKR